MTQLSLNKGLKEFSSRGEEAVSKELLQLHMRNVFQPLHISEIPKDKQFEILESHLFLEEKRDSTVKGRLVAGGNKQREYINKHDIGSPTCSLEIILLTSMIKYREERDFIILILLIIFS